MIVYDLSCSHGHRFEGWFGSSTDFSDQQARGLMTCPQCGSQEVAKAPMAPAIPAKGKRRTEGHQTEQVASGTLPVRVRKAFEKLVTAQAKALEKSTWVGDDFAEKAREMHYGEVAEAPIHGRATRDQAENLAAEGISVGPLLVPVTPPDELN
jgi:hypothetical protein